MSFFSSEAESHLNDYLLLLNLFQQSERYELCSKIKKVSTYENIEEVNIEYNVENVQTKVEEVAIGILLVSRYVLILDKP